MKKNTWKTVLTVVVLLALAAALVVAAVECANGASLANPAWSLLPPVIAIILALITKEAYSALFIGVLVGGLFTCGFAPVATLDTIVNDGLIAAISGNAGIFLFLVLLGIIVALVNAAGGSAAFGRWAETHIKTRVGAQLATFVLGVLIFIDDYFNCLTVGSVMRPVTDNHKISRPKLAYLIDATAAPVCMIAPISSWAAAVSTTAADLDTGVRGARVIFHGLSKFGHGDLAMKMIVREDYPSYGNWVARGATSLWEMMMPDDNVGSMNHHFWGDISGWFIQCAAGLRPNPDADDALRVDFEPGLNCGLARASAHTQAACGETSLRWRLNGDQAQIELTLPESAHGEVILPEGWTFGRGKSRLPARTGAFIALKQ